MSNDSVHTTTKCGYGNVVTSANLHIIGLCNYRCEHCFDRCLVKEWMEPREWIPRLNYLYSIGIRKVNIAGGEPMLYPHLNEMCQLIKSMGFVTSIVSNGSLMTDEWVSHMAGIIDWIGLSIDSPSEKDEVEIGRHMQGISHIENIKKLAKSIRANGIGFKLNITVVRKSWHHDFNPLIDELRPDRIKVFRALSLANANDDREDSWSISDRQFSDFISRHEHQKNIIFEDNDLMAASYLMFDPIGRWTTNDGYVKQFHPFEQLVSEGIIGFPQEVP